MRKNGKRSGKKEQHGRKDALIDTERMRNEVKGDNDERSKGEINGSN